MDHDAAAIDALTEGLKRHVNLLVGPESARRLLAEARRGDPAGAIEVRGLDVITAGTRRTSLNKRDILAAGASEPCP